MSDFNNLPFNKTCVFNSHIEGSDTLVRTGTMNNDILSIFNSILYACSKKFIINTDENEKIKQIHDFKDYIFNMYSETDKFKLFNKLFIDFIYNKLEQLYGFLNEDLEEVDKDVKFIMNKLLIDEDSIELYKLITEIVPIDGFKKIYNITLKKWTDNSVDKFRNILLKETIKYTSYNDIFDEIDKEKGDFIKKSILILLDIIINIAKNNFTQPQLPNIVDSELINFLSDKFEYDIYFIDSKTRKPFILKDQNILHIKSIVILSFDNKKFEIVGKLLKNNKIQREFMPYDDVIKSINFYLNKNKVREDVLEDFREDVQDDFREDVRDDIRDDIRDNIREDVPEDVRDDVRDDVHDILEN